MARPTDAAGLVAAYAIVLIAIPEWLVLPGLRSAGVPAIVLGLALLAWWAASRLVIARAWQPMTVAMATLVVVVLVSYAVGMAGPLAGDQVGAADRGLIVVLSGAGVVLLLSDYAAEPARLRVVMATLVVMGGALAAVALLQSVGGIDPVSDLRLPMLRSMVGGTGAGDSRLGFARVAGTAAHPIEMGVALAAIIPIGLQLALRERMRTMLVPTALMVCAVPVALSRSALIALLVVAAVMLAELRGRERAVAVGTLIAAGAAIAVLKPGLWLSDAEMFAGIATDDSTHGRTADYAVIGSYILRSPVIGSGMGTFVPGRFPILDNQYLLTLSDMGVLGLVALAALPFVGIVLAATVRRRATDAVERGRAAAIVAGIAAIAASLAFFDGLSFTMSTGVLWLLLGMSGALWRLRAAATAPGDERPVSPSATRG